MLDVNSNTTDNRNNINKKYFEFGPISINNKYIKIFDIEIELEILLILLIGLFLYLENNSDLILFLILFLLIIN